MEPPDPSRRAVSECVGRRRCLATVVGSGIMGERLSAGNVAVALLANTLATGAGLVALILTFGPISGAHSNPVVTVADATQGENGWRRSPCMSQRKYRARCGRGRRALDVRRADFRGVTTCPCRDTPALQRVHRDLRSARRHLGRVEDARDRRPLRGWCLHHCRVLVYGINVVRESCGHVSARCDGYIRQIARTTRLASLSRRSRGPAPRPCCSGGLSPLNARLVPLREEPAPCTSPNRCRAWRRRAIHEDRSFCVRSQRRQVLDGGGAFQSLCRSAKGGWDLGRTEPGSRVHPEVLEALGIDIDVSGAVPRLSDELASKANVLVTMGCGETYRWCPASNASIGRWRTRRDARSHTSARIRNEVRGIGCVRSSLKDEDEIRDGEEAGTVELVPARKDDEGAYARTTEASELPSLGSSPHFPKDTWSRAPTVRSAVPASKCMTETACSGPWPCGAVAATFGLAPGSSRTGCRPPCRRRCETFISSPPRRRFFERFRSSRSSVRRCRKSIRNSPEFASICPSSAAVFRRSLRNT